jgi:molybdenum cofactor biosynthesis enzyme MoaA
LNNGSYLDQDRFNLTTVDRVLRKLSQKERVNSLGFKTLVKELSKLHPTKVIITGGEPFLYNNLLELLHNIPQIVETITIYTGLGVNPSRFEKQLKKINLNNVKIVISAENCEKFYEFNRYGNSYKNFLTNLDHVKSFQSSLGFTSVVSNLTVFGLESFSRQFTDSEIKYSFCNDPDFL